jgi:hypothetical protein
MPHFESPHSFRRLGFVACRFRPSPQRILASLGIALLSLAACSGPHRTPETSQPTAAEKAYLQNIEVTGAQMTAAKNFLQHTVTTLHAQVTNKGNQAVTFLELDLVFSNFMGQVDLREKAHPVKADTPPLKPGETRAFEVSFDRVPDDWNQAAPQVTATRVVLSENR